MLHAYLRLIVLNDLPLSIVECTSLHSLSKFSEVICCRQLIDVIVEFVTLVEKRISDEILQTKELLSITDRQSIQRISQQLLHRIEYLFLP